MTAAGWTPRGWPWWVIRRRGGRLVRITVPGWAVDEETIRDVIDRRVRALFDPPDNFHD